MSALRVRILLNKGGRGVPLKKLAPINQMMASFLTMLGSDLQLFQGKQEWLAVEFDEIGSVAFDIECPSPIGAADIRHFGEVLKDISQLDEGTTTDRLDEVQPATIRQYAKLADPLGPNEEMDLGIYYNGTPEPAHWESHSKKRANEIVAVLQDTIHAYGSIQGTISTLNKSDKSNMSFIIRELASGNRIRCIFDKTFYHNVIEQLEDQDQVVFVSGLMKLSRINRKIDELKVEKIAPAPSYKEGDLGRFIGGCPDLTGDLSTADYVDKFRADFK